MLHVEQDQEDEEAIFDPDSEISEADDPEYVPQGQAGVVGVPGSPASRDEDSFDDTSSEEGDKSWDVSFQELFCDLLQNPMDKATMGVRRYEDIRSFMRFDDKRTRPIRQETDHMAAFRYVWDCFLVNGRRQFIPSDCVTVDEQLVPFRGRCKFIQYMPSKPAKYRIQIF
ncbi:hypothetical protein SKAU_G00283660 [Synaphobranchus kaupii]|uniref:PiggyBac transposable element-derived protein domain-containing protein n=1 Tax=Synaphobranchus kaupii TaxID=118154 RepID=A0A9Q1EXM9_SYNKA|nr:hypothetical protein SKAU_G00283660 [Synaphobranchus kaupii]